MTTRQFLKDWIAYQNKVYNKKSHKLSVNDYLIANKDEWAYCPKCQLEWNSKRVGSPFMGIAANHKPRHLVKANVEDKKKRPDKLCPIHGESVVDGRRMGPLTYVDKRSLNKINKSGPTHCPNCKNNGLVEQNVFPNLCKCRACNSITRIIKHGPDGLSDEFEVVECDKFEVVEIVYREDLDTANELLLEGLEIIDSPAVMIEGTK
jgi:hypothetical protein